MLFTNLDLVRQEGLDERKGRAEDPETPGKSSASTRKRLSRWRVPGKSDSGLSRLGFAPAFGDSYLYMFAFEAGGKLLSPDGLTATMDSPRVVRALRYMTDVYDDLGGVEQANAFSQSFQPTRLDPFLHGPGGDEDRRQLVPGDARGLEARHELLRLARPDAGGRAREGARSGHLGERLGVRRSRDFAAQEGGVRAHPVPSEWEIVDRLEESRRERKQNEGRLYLPNVDANRKFTERMFREKVFDEPVRSSAYPATPTDRSRTLLENPSIRPPSPVGTTALGTARPRLPGGGRPQVRRGGAGDRATTRSHRACPNAGAGAAPARRALPPAADPRRGMAPYFGVYCRRRRCASRRRSGFVAKAAPSHGYRMRETGAAIFFASPWIVGFAVLPGGPILFSIVFSFTRYDVLDRRATSGSTTTRGPATTIPFLQEPAQHGVHAAPRSRSIMAAVSRIALLLNPACARSASIAPVSTCPPSCRSSRRACCGCGSSIRARAS